MRRTRIEHMSAGLPPKADIAQRGWNGRKVPKGDMILVDQLLLLNMSRLNRYLLRFHVM